MKTRQEILIEANKETWNKCLDSFVNTEIEYKNTHLNTPLDVRSDLPFEEDVQIEDSYVLTKFVMFEKYILTSPRWSYKHWSTQIKEKHYKVITKKSEDGTVRFVKIDRDNINLWADFTKLQNELDLKKYNVLSDGYDLSQVIKYYSISNSNF
jgi:hypothetical protein